MERFIVTYTEEFSTLTIVLLLIVSGCTHENPNDRNGSVKQPAPTCNAINRDLTDGNYTIEVNHNNGVTDVVAISVASPPIGDGPLPVVVFAGGFGGLSMANCTSTRLPNLENDLQSLVDQGYLVVQIHYRSNGAQAPGLGTLKPRDWHLYDARAQLAAAVWAKTRHQRGSDQVALLGSSAGVFVTLSAVTPQPELADLQACLDVRSAVLMGESGNHLANNHKHSTNWETANELGKMVHVGGAYTSVLWRLMASERTDELRQADLESGDLGSLLAQGFHDRLRDLFVRTALLPADTSLNGCSELAGKPAVCENLCFQSALLHGVNEMTAADPTINANDRSDWLVDDGIGQQYIEWWDESGCQQNSGSCKTEPTAVERAANPYIDAAWTTSPVYFMDGLLPNLRVLHLVSENDPHYGIRRQNQLHSKLESLGVVPNFPQISVDPTGDCGHPDYIVKSRGVCGYDFLVSELTEAFSQD